MKNKKIPQCRNSSSIR